VNESTWDKKRIYILMNKSAKCTLKKKRSLVGVTDNFCWQLMIQFLVAF